MAILIGPFQFNKILLSFYLLTWRKCLMEKRWSFLSWNLSKNEWTSASRRCHFRLTLTQGSWAEKKIICYFFLSIVPFYFISGLKIPVIFGCCKNARCGFHFEQKRFTCSSVLLIPKVKKPEWTGLTQEPSRCSTVPYFNLDRV